jgi:hypothetical protein
MTQAIAPQPQAHLPLWRSCWGVGLRTLGVE